MAYLGVQRDRPEMADAINALAQRIIDDLRDEKPDVKVNAVARVAVAMLHASDVTKEQAIEFFTRLIGGMDDWSRMN